MTHNFKPVTPTEEIQVAILDELQKISSLLEPSQDPAPAEPPADPEPAAPAPAEKSEPAKAPAKKTAQRTTKKVNGR